jgi:hypothetical protein
LEIRNRQLADFSPLIMIAVGAISQKVGFFVENYSSLCSWDQPLDYYRGPLDPSRPPHEVVWKNRSLRNKSREELQMGTVKGHASI